MSVYNSRSNSANSSILTLRSFESKFNNSFSNNLKLSIFLLSTKSVVLFKIGKKALSTKLDGTFSFNSNTLFATD